MIGYVIFILGINITWNLGKFLGPTPVLQNQKLGVGHSSLCFNKSS